MVIVVDEKNDENVKFVTMVNDGTGNGIVIPSLLINKDPGTILIDYFSNSDYPTVKLMAAFDIAHPDNHVEYDLIFSTYSENALDFITGFREYHDKLEGKALMTPHYISYPCESCSDEIKATDCFGNGKYCSLDAADLAITGQSILLANIRQKCLYKNSLALNNNDTDWWDYMVKAHSVCYSDFTEDCSKGIHTRLGLDFKKTEK